MPLLNTGSVHIWHESLTGSRYLSDSYRQLLSNDEQARAKRFKFAELSEHHIIGKVKLRLILADYLKVAPETIRFASGTWGKPYIAYPATELCFNLSHTGSDMVIAIARNLQLGIDIETLRPLSDLSSLVQTCLAPEEQRHWADLPQAQQLAGFYHFWVCKEAWVKAIGCGIGIGIDQCILNLKQSNRYYQLPGHHAADWHYRKLTLKPDIAGAIATKGEDIALHQLRL